MNVLFAKQSSTVTAIHILMKIQQCSTLDICVTIFDRFHPERRRKQYLYRARGSISHPTQFALVLLLKLCVFYVCVRGAPEKDLAPTRHVFRPTRTRSPTTDVAARAPHI